MDNKATLNDSNFLNDHSPNNIMKIDHKITESMRVGKGSIIIENNVLELILGKCIVLDVNEKKGPCPDNMCQLSTEISVKIIDKMDDVSNYRMINEGKFTIAMDERIWQAIDKERQIISIKKKKLGGIKVSGFSMIC